MHAFPTWKCPLTMIKISCIYVYYRMHMKFLWPAYIHACIPVRYSYDYYPLYGPYRQQYTLCYCMPNAFWLKGAPTLKTLSGSVLDCISFWSLQHYKCIYAIHVLTNRDMQVFPHGSVLEVPYTNMHASIRTYICTQTRLYLYMDLDLLYV